MVQNWNFNLELFLLASPIIIYIDMINFVIILQIH